jgi:hypothetical protein
LASRFQSCRRLGDNSAGRILTLLNKVGFVVSRKAAKVDDMPHLPPQIGFFVCVQLDLPWQFGIPARLCCPCQLIELANQEKLMPQPSPASVPDDVSK